MVTVLESTAQRMSMAGWKFGFDGNMEKPTISPSVLSSYKNRESKDVTVCHLFVKDGNIQFLSDCQHRLAGMTVPMEHFPDDYEFIG